MKIVTILGARPQFIKASVVSNAFSHAGINEIIIHTGQHFDSLMSDIFFQDLDLPQPHYHLNIHSLNHGAMTGRMMEKIEEILLTEQSIWISLWLTSIDKTLLPKHIGTGRYFIWRECDKFHICIRWTEFKLYRTYAKIAETLIYRTAKTPRPPRIRRTCVSPTI